MSIFKSCDIRGIYGKDLTEDVAYRLGRAVGSRLQGKTVLVAGDLRPSTPALARSVMQGLLESGADVLDAGRIPTPTFYFALQHLQAAGGIMVTASHNPARYNGFKVMLGEWPITEEELAELAAEMEAGAFSNGQGRCRRVRVLAAYADRLAQAFGDLGQHHLVVDAGNGSAGPVAPPILRRLGQKVEALYCEPDGTFPHRDPNPAVASHLVALQHEVQRTGAELGAAYDGDGDRVIFVDETGAIHAADRLLVLFIRHLLADHPGAAVVYDLKSSSVVPEEILKSGGRPLMERSGHAFIKRRLIEEGAILGGEVSGHYFFGELRGDDALYATLLLLRVLDRLGIPLSEAMATVPAYPITPDIRLPCAPETVQAILEELAKAFADLPLSFLDGVRIAFPEGWALVRPSVTEPLITLRFEARSERALQEIQRAVRDASPTLRGIGWGEDT